jgi:hypothetical protein
MPNNMTDDRVVAGLCGVACIVIGWAVWLAAGIIGRACV